METCNREKELVTELNIIEQGKPITDKLLAKEHGTVELNTLLPFSTMQATDAAMPPCCHASMHRTVVETRCCDTSALYTV